jgi:hypothetical protein
MEQMVEHLVATIGKIDADQAKMDASLRKMKTEIRTDREGMMARLEAMIQNNKKRWKPG